MLKELKDKQCLLCKNNHRVGIMIYRESKKYHVWACNECSNIETIPKYNYDIKPEYKEK
jgi:hypothetical protein